MTIKLPNPYWRQDNNGDRFDPNRLGGVFYTYNINFDERGYAKLSPRTIAVMDSGQNSDFGVPVAIGRYSTGSYQVATTDKNFVSSISTISNSHQEDDAGSNVPNLSADSFGEWFQGKWHVTTDTDLLSKDALGNDEDWTVAKSNDITSGKNHNIAVFDSRVTICVSDGNVVEQYDTSYANSNDLTIPSDFEVTGLSYNASNMAVATRVQDGSGAGQDNEARLFIWNGATTGAQNDPGVGSDRILGLSPYASSFTLINGEGEMLFYNGGGLSRAAKFPVLVTDHTLAISDSNNNLGTLHMKSRGEIVYINMVGDVDPYGLKGLKNIVNQPSGVWCFDPEIGLYHRYSPSTSLAEVDVFNGTNINTSTDVITTSAVTVPDTGNIVIMTNDSAEVSGVQLNKPYYIIKVSDTTFKLATTLEKAKSGDAVDITSVTTSGNATAWWFYTISDYGQLKYSVSGAIALTLDNSPIYQEIIFGSQIVDKTDVTLSVNNLSIAVPLLDNRGAIVTPKIFAKSITERVSKLYVRYRPLDTSDSIVVKYRGKDLLGLPVFSSGKPANWLSKNIFTTTQDLSEAKDHLQTEELEVLFTAGVGGGQSSKITSIDTDDDVTYSVTTEDDIIGASNGMESEFQIENWTTVRTLTNTDVNDNGYADVGFNESIASKFSQWKLELRGVGITIEDISFNNKPSQLE